MVRINRFIKFFIVIAMVAFMAIMTVPILNVSAHDSITREQWVNELVTLFDIFVEDDNMPDDYFTDLDINDASYKNIMMAVEFGFVDLEPGLPFEPYSPATREFVSYTLNYGLGFQIEEITYDFKDLELLKYPEAAQTSVNHDWFTINNKMFEPNKSITLEEKNNIVRDVSKILEKTEIDVNYQNEYKYKSNVIEIEEGTDVAFNDNIITIKDSPKLINKNDIFVAYFYGFPTVFEAKNVSVIGNNYQIEVVELDLNEYLEAIDVENIVESDLSLTEAVDDAEVLFIDDDFIQTYGVQVFGVTAQKNGIIINKNLNLGKGKEATVSIALSRLAIEQKLHFNRFYSYVAVVGDYDMKVSASFDAVESGGHPSQLVIAKVPMGPPGFIATISLEYDLNGNISLVINGNFKSGIEYDKGQFRVISSFRKNSFTISASIKAKTGIRTNLGFDYKVIKGNIYASAGAIMNQTIHVYNDGTKPILCEHFYSYLYAKAGGNIGVDLGFYKDSLKKDIDIYNLDNSPVKLINHFEDGNPVPECTRDKDDHVGNGYFTPVSSKYGSISKNGYGINSNKEIVPIFTYTINGNEATITGSNHLTGAVVIPSMIDGYKVTAIGGSAFRDEKGLSSITIPNTVKSIGSYAIYGTNLRSLSLPDSITYIGNYGISSNHELINLKLSKSLKELGFYALSNNTKLESIEIPKSLTNVIDYAMRGFGPLDGNTSLKEVTFESGITHIPDYLLGNNNTLINLKNVVIPNTVTHIGMYSFYNTKIEEIIMPDSVLYVGHWGIGNNKELKTLKLSKSLKELGFYAFSNNTKLESIEIPKSLSKVIDYAMRGFGPLDGNTSLIEVTFEKGTTFIPDYILGNQKTLVNLKTIEIPDTVTEIGQYAFYGTLFEAIEMPDSVVSISHYSFSNMHNLKELKISKSLRSMGFYAFSQSLSLERVEIPKTLTTVTDYAGRLVGPFDGSTALKEVTFEQGMTRIPRLLFSSNSSLPSLKTVNLPNTIIRIEDYAFKSAPIENITFPESLEYIGKEAFIYGKQREVHLPKNVSFVGDAAFYNNEPLISVKSDGKGVMGKNVFANNPNLEKIELSDQIYEIGQGFAHTNPKLVDVKLGKYIKTLPQDSFSRCESLETFVLPRFGTTVNNEALSENKNLRDVYISNTYKTFSITAFKDSPLVTLRGKEGIGLEGYAEHIDVNFRGELIPIENIKISEENLFLPFNTDIYVPIEIEPGFDTENITFEVPKNSALYLNNDGRIYTQSFGRHELLVKTDDKEFSFEFIVTRGFYTVDFETNGGSEIHSLKDLLTDTYLERPIDPFKEGFTFVGWFKDAEFTKAWDFKYDSVNEDMTLYAKWKPVDQMINIMVQIDGEGSVTGEGVYGLGEDVELNAIANEGYVFIGWYEDNNLIKDANKTYVFKANKDRNLVAKFTLKDIKVTSISLNKSSLDLIVGESETLKETILPSNATDKQVNFASSNAKVAIVNSVGKVTAIAKGTATITVITQDGNKKARTLVTVREVVEPKPEVLFSDVPVTNSFYHYVEDLYADGIINGYDDGSFRPNNPLTRAQAAVMIVRAAGVSTDGVSSNFKDVSSTHNTYKFISAAYEAGIINGYSDGTFKPNDNVTRAQIATMVARAFDLKKDGNPPKFVDVERLSSAGLREYIYTLSSLDIVKGYGNEFRPNNSVTRGQFSKMVSIARDPDKYKE